MNHCPACGSSSFSFFYSVDRIPVHSVRLLWSEKEALAFPCGDIHLAHCQNCGFIWNNTFESELQDYSDSYESTQAYSATYNSFAINLATDIISRNKVYKKDILEIGCGQGEFLSLLCDIGNNRGIGFDPAYQPERAMKSGTANIDIIQDYYSEKYTSLNADLIACKMTLEHIPLINDFIATVRRSIAAQKNTIVFFQVPNILRILDEFAFWDIYYEHCSYFSPGSLARSFRQNKFDITKLWLDYGDQYLMIEALPVEHPTEPQLPEENDLAMISQKVNHYANLIKTEHEYWKEKIFSGLNRGKKVILWGSGSKAVSFLTTLQINNHVVEYTIDINPLKWNTYLAGTGQKVVGPDILSVYRPDLIILMNPLYTEEVQALVDSSGISAEICSVGVLHGF
jgi:2-polyprenyl-3-methyl-5-hydroxy-6-metoxy-1,4-benzoquinol methylase